MLGSDPGLQSVGQILPPGRGGAQRHSGCRTDPVVTIAGLGRTKPCSRRHTRTPGERLMMSLTVNLAANSLRFVPVRSGLLPSSL